jgi:hypothetical protein
VQFLGHRVRLAALLAAESVAVVAVHRLGARAPFDLPLTALDPWLRATPADALAAALRLAALGVVWWLFAATALYIAAAVVGRRGRGRVARTAGALSARVTPRAIRVAVDRALATSITVGALLVPAGARAVAADDPSPSVSVDVRDGRGEGSITSLPTEPIEPGPPPQTTSEASPPALPTTSHTPEPSFVVVVPGDNLWSLSADALARATGRAHHVLTDDEIARYWIAVCNANRGALRSGDVNLIYPGEVVLLPPVR